MKPYNPNLIPYARAMRKELTSAGSRLGQGYLQNPNCGPASPPLRSRGGAERSEAEGSGRGTNIDF